MISHGSRDDLEIDYNEKSTSNTHKCVMRSPRQLFCSTMLQTKDLYREKQIGWTLGDGGRPTVGICQLRKFPPPRARWIGVSRYGESCGKGPETTQTRSKDDPPGGDVPEDLVKRRLPIGASPHNRGDLPETGGLDA